MQLKADFLIVGSGLTGLFFAVKAAACGSVVIITKEEPGDSNTSYAQGGIASVVAPGDSVAQHVADTLAAGDGLCDPAVVEAVVAEAPAVVDELVRLGARFTRGEAGQLSVGREGGHSASRIVHADDMTGQELIRTLLAAAQADPRVRLLSHHLALELLLDGAGNCAGVAALDTRGHEVVEVRAPVTLLATGGAGQMYLNTTNPSVATGDGMAMAWRAGARVGNLEFVQFHPTVLYDPGRPSFLISEAVRGFGGVLVNHLGQQYIEHPLGSLATRDIVARASLAEMARTGHPCVYLDVTAKDPEATRRRFPNIDRHCREAGWDMTQQRLPVVPAAHYMCGGVVTDLNGRTDLAGLYASGEVAMTGFHGANRLASNSLLEALVLAKRAFLDAANAARSVTAATTAWDCPGAVGLAEAGAADCLRLHLRQVMWERVGIVRRDAGLASASAELRGLANEADLLYRRHVLAPAMAEVRNLSTVGWLAAEAARRRLESRGGHYNEDHPARDDEHWGRPIWMDRRTLGGP